jgi:hypothetical protein
MNFLDEVSSQSALCLGSPLAVDLLCTIGVFEILI